MATIPAIESLKAYPNWVCYREQPHPRTPGKVKKPIISPVTGTNGSHSNPQDWTIYQKAKAFYIVNKNKLGLKGLGFVFSENVPVVGIDLDNCVIDGKLNEFARKQLELFPSYAEESISGKGIHILGLAEQNFDAVTNEQIEIYSRNRYFVITGKHIEGTSDTLKDIWTKLRYRVLPVENESSVEITISDVNEMLSYIPGDGLDYNVWLRILMSVHSEFPGGDGLAAVEAWTGAYCLPNELEQKWKSFRKGGINIGTLVHFAKEYGYQRNEIDLRLDKVRPRLDPVQKDTVRQIVEELAEKRAWEIYHQELMRQHIDTGFPEQVEKHFRLGWRQPKIDRETGEILLPGAVTVPYFVNDEVVSIEFRSDYSIEYDGAVGLYEVEPMFPEETSYGIIVPDSLQAIKTYLGGTGNAAIYGLPHETITLELPDTEMFCFFDGQTNRDMLELLDSYGVKFVEVMSIDSMLKYMKRDQIERLASRGRKLKEII